MKIRYYMDIFPGCNFATYTPLLNANPGTKVDGAVRIAFDLVIPDSVMNAMMKVDVESPEASFGSIVP